MGSKIKILNSTFEISLRFLAILFQCNYPLSEFRLRAYSYLCIHLSDIKDTSESLHPALPYRSILFLSTQEIINPALHILLTKELISCCYKNNGIIYEITTLGRYYIDAIHGTYKEKLIKAIKDVDDIFKSMDDEDLKKRISNRIDDWGSEFSNENLLKAEEYVE